MGLNDPGALVVYIGELDLSTDLVGDSQETVITTNVLDSCAYFIDDKRTSTMPAEISTATPHSSMEHWKVCYFSRVVSIRLFTIYLLQQLGYALLAEMNDVGLRLRHASDFPINTQVRLKPGSVLGPSIIFF